MDKKSKILLWIFFLLIVGSVAVTYWRIMIKRDYVIESQIDCDPYTEKCFVWECDPNSTVEGEACTENPDDNIWYFKVARRNAANIPLCDPETDETCDPWTCSDGEKDCESEFCTQENMEAQYASSCVDPVQFTIDNPIEEEEIACEEGDEECAIELEESICEEGDEECLESEEVSEEEAEECAEGEDCEVASEPATEDLTNTTETQE